MAEGLQKKIEYADLQFISAFAMEKILDFQTWEDPGEHARGNFRLLLSENETGINSMNAPIQLLGQGNTAGALFSGYPEKVEIKEERGYRIADIQAVSGTILLDQKKSNRVFQKKVQTYMGIASAVTADTDHSACILPGSDMRTGGTLIQYQETDWRFLKRMASQLGLPLVPDTSYYYPRFYLGLPEGEKRELGEIIACDLCFDGRYYAVSGKCLVDREDFICYDVVTRTSLSLGDRVTYEGRELLVSRKKTELAGGEVIFTYRLAGNSYTWVPWEDNPDYTGMSFVGSIVGTQGEQVEVAFDIDKSAAGGNRYGFAPATGNLMYCMPQKGTKTALYIGNGDEAQGIATGCIRTNGSTCEGTGSPEKKSFRSEHGKGMDLYPQRMGLDGGETGKITFEDETGTTIESNGGLVLMAKEGIRLESMTGIAMQGMSDIMALYSEGASSLCVNGSVDMLGKMTGLAGTVYQKYDPFEDAPQEGEFDWGGFARNLVMGLAVGAACIALAVFLPGIGTVAAGALFGAGMGAISASVVGAVNDYSSGNVRSLGEATRDMVISMVTGAITGAIGAAFPALNWVGEGLVDLGSGVLTRGMYALVDSNMSIEEKLAYAFDWKQMGADFLTGVAIHFVFKGIDELRTGKKTAYRGQYSFDIDMNGNEVSCISDFYDIENLAAIEDARFYNEPTFYKVEVGGNQSVYVSTGNIRQSQFAEIVNQSSGDISIVSGMHGGPDGSLLSEYNGVSGKQLLNEDLKVWGDSLNIKIYDVSKLSSEELKSVIKSSDITICGWCFSERSKLLLEALGCL